MKSPPELRSTGYRFKLEDYASIYQVSRQTIARWANNMYGGYPLDDPKQTHLYVLMQERQPDNFPMDLGQKWIRRYRDFVRRKERQ